MPRRTVFALYFLAVFLQAGAYGLTFLLPDLFSQFQANEKNVGQMLATTKTGMPCLFEHFIDKAEDGR